MLSAEAAKIARALSAAKGTRKSSTSWQLASGSADQPARINEGVLREMGFTPEQLTALDALMAAVCLFYPETWAGTGKRGLNLTVTGDYAASLRDED